MHKVMEESGLPPYLFYDLRGNHDKFGVPMVGSTLDYFSKYSISSLRNRSNAIQSVTLMNGDWKYLFLGVDTSMDVGLRGPSHLFGHPTDELLTKIDSELGQWDSHIPGKVRKIVFGHYPLSFTTSTQGKRRLEPLFAKHSISAYLCGHLHTIFGQNIVKHHFYPRSQSKSRDEEFWEWEMGDWRTSRMIRIVAIDEGHTSYSDFDLSNINGSHDNGIHWLPTLVIPTYPLDSQKMNRLKPSNSSSKQDFFRALVLSGQSLITVTARIFDALNGEMELLEELDMHMLSKPGETAYIYASEWDGGKYTDPSGTRYAYLISVVDSLGIHTNSSLRPFSVDHRFGGLKKTWKEFIVMDIVFEHAYIFLLWLAFTILLIFFILPKAMYHVLRTNGSYDGWVYTLFRGRLCSLKAIELFIWFFLQGCANNAVWCIQLIAVIWIFLFPWFWGEVLPEGYPIGSMSIWGWNVPLDRHSAPRSGLGWPDVMVVVLPYLFFVILPLYALIFALSAEAAVRKFYRRDAHAYKKRGKEEDEDGQWNLALPDNDAFGGDRKSTIGGSSKVGLKNDRKSVGSKCIRMVLLGLCAVTAFIHFEQVRALAGAHGVLIILASPGFAWLAPVLMTTAILQYSSCRKET